MPHKHNAGKRHHIPKARFTVTNWPQYENGLRQRGSLTLWITPDVIAEWKAAPCESPGGQRRYSDLAIQACLMVRTAYRMPLRQAEGLMASVFRLMNLSLAVPDHTTVSRRAAVLTPRNFELFEAPDTVGWQPRKSAFFTRVRPGVVLF